MVSSHLGTEVWGGGFQVGGVSRLRLGGWSGQPLPPPSVDPSLPPDQPQLGVFDTPNPYRYSSISIFCKFPDIFKNGLIDIDIFNKCRYIDNRYGLSIYRTPLTSPSTRSTSAAQQHLLQLSPLALLHGPNQP